MRGPRVDLRPIQVLHFVIFYLRQIIHKACNEMALLFFEIYRVSKLCAPEGEMLILGEQNFVSQ